MQAIMGGSMQFPLFTLEPSARHAIIPLDLAGAPDQKKFELAVDSLEIQVISYIKARAQEGAVIDTRFLRDLFRQTKQVVR